MPESETPQAQRKLAAIVVADVVGYSRQMAAGEVATLDRLRLLRSDVLDPALRRHSGRLVKLMGDGLLVEFASAVSAAAWAVEVQKAIAERNVGVPDAEAMVLRIGVNVGDVILEGDDIFGDGVNVAARLEPLAPQGGVCISAAVYEHVQGKVAAEFRARGERALKNIARPVTIYSWSPRADDDDASAPAATPAREHGRKPTLVVKPFDTVGSSGDASFLAAAVYEQTTSSLSNLTGLAMLSDGSRSDYTATGTIQTAGQRYRATVRLTDNRSGQQFWSDRFDGDLAELFRAQDEIAYRISTALRFSVYDREVAEMAKLPADQRTTEMIFARVGQTIAGANREEWPEAGPALERILEKDPTSSGAHAIKSGWHLYEVFYGWKPIAPDDVASCLAHARQAVRFNERSDFAHLMMALAHLYADNDPGRALRESERALELSPYYALGHYLKGLSLLFGGDAVQGLELCVGAANASARMVNQHRILQAAALAAFLAGRSEEAIEYASRSDQQLDDVAPTLLVLAAAGAVAGDEHAKTHARTRLLALFPDFRRSAMRRWPFRRDADLRLFEEALAAAGLPD